MLVSAAPFFVFLVAVCLLYWASAGHRRVQLAILVIANLFFLARFSLIYLLLPIATSIDFLIGLGFARLKAKSNQRMLLGVSLFLNLSLLLSLKLIPLTKIGHLAWLFPLSLSFYCFQSLSYTIDLYFGEMQPTRSYTAYLASALFFPSITAGPIPRTRKLLAQFVQPFTLSSEDAGRAFLLIGVGLVKKNPRWRLRLRPAIVLRLLRLH
jgi:alginate O-acetyltransferase complex protein AlgI